MAKDKLVISKNAAKVRKHWLIATCFQFLILAPFLCILKLLFIPMESSAKTELVGETIGYALTSFISFYIVYYCAYKKFGTGWLTFSLIFGLISLIAQLLLTLTDSSYIGFAMANIWWLLISLKLRKANIAIQLNNKPTDPVYTQSLLELESAQNLEDLDAKFYALVEKTPMYK